jgi:hypothetical protein
MNVIAAHPWHRYADNVGAVSTYAFLRGARDRTELRCLGLRPRPLVR